MSDLAVLLLGSSRQQPFSQSRKDKERERAMIFLFVAAALSAGVFAALASADEQAFAGSILLIAAVAWTLPLAWIGLVLAALVPFQFYLTIPDTALTLRAAVVFVLAVGIRLVVAARNKSDAVQRNGVRLSIAARFSWLLPSLLFLFVAFVAALGAQDKYAAFKGIYEWLAILATAFIIVELSPTLEAVRRILVVLVAGGLVQAVLGIVQYALGLDTVLDLLRLPVSGLLYQPNLLKERLGELNFNWIASGRALPFGTFINGIDYAVYLAAILSLIFTLSVARGASTAGSRRSAVWQNRTLLYTLGGLVVAAAVLLTFKGSSLLALMGGIATVGLFSLRRLSRRTLFMGLALLVGSLVLALPFADLLGQRALFLVEREQGGLGTAGRLQIWAGLLQFIGQRPLFGFGLNNAVWLVEPQPTLRAGVTGVIIPTPESAYVSLLVETGIAGFVAFAGWMLSALVSGYRRACVAHEGTLHIGMVAALVALLLGNLTVTGLTTDQTGMLLGLLIGLIYGSQRDDRVKQD